MATDRREERQTQLRAAFEAAGLDALLISHLPNIRYLTGFTGSAGLLLVRPDRASLLTDFRYAAQAPQEVGQSAAVEVDPVSVWDRLRRLLDADPIGVLGLEAHSLTVRDAERVSAATRGRVVPSAGLVEQLRAIKSPEEVAAIRAAAALAQDALAEVVSG
ncbi:MAG TPA: aminopeptidase P family N-terminal domain-containing protein, partial [Gemmatimonadales bacterium]|nr:aminopeptidase P family N-terminal domain-containing protein [Gemmatimonadales bacterium]